MNCKPDDIIQILDFVAFFAIVFVFCAAAAWRYATAPHKKDDQ